jgi:hypothetical protein
MSEAVRIEERLADLISGRRRKHGPQHHDRQTPREMEQQAMERLYGERSSTVVLDRHEQPDEDV